MSDDVSREVDQLLADREKYRTWLQRLEQQKASTSAEAYERVQRDYRNRLEEVDRKLQSHGDSIRDRLREVQTAVGDLEAQRADRAQKLEEARLRRNVGEYPDDAEWAELQDRLTGAVQDAEQQLESARQEVQRLNEIVAHVEQAAAHDASQPAAGAAGGASGPSGGSAGAGKPASRPAPTETAQSASEDDVMSLDDLVLPEEEFSDEVDQVAEAGSSAPSGGSADDSLGDELAFLESLSLDSDEDIDSLAFMERGRGEPQTVLCPNCSAANDPAEWYCTECGEELPAE